MHNHIESAVPSGLLDGLSASVIVVDREDHVSYVNAAAESLLKTTRGNVIKRPLNQLLEDAAPLIEMIGRCRDDRATYVYREFTARPHAHPEFATIVDVASSPFESGGVILEMHDARLAAQFDNEARLLAQHDVGRAIVRQLAHEIKNPLGGLRGAAQLLAKRLGGQGLTEFTDVIIREADRLVTLVDTMLGPTGPLKRAPVSIHRVLDHVWQLMDAEAPDGVHVERDYDPSLPDVEADEDRAIQALLNLGRNALQAVGKSGEVILRTRAVSGFTIGEQRHSLVVRIDVEDSGPGVDEALRDKLFYPLVTGRAGGTGLGLAVAQDLISLHGGLIKLDSGERTVFSVFLPIDTGT